MKPKLTTPTSSTKPTGKAKSKATTKSGNKTQGGGGRAATGPASPKMDSDSEKKTQSPKAIKPGKPLPGANEPTGPEIDLGLAALYLLDGKKTVWSKPPILRDHLIDHVRRDPKEAKLVMHLMGNIMRVGIMQLMEWRGRKDQKEVSTWAQSLLADLLSGLEEAGMAKLPRSPLYYGNAFARRWAELHPLGRKGSSFAAVKLFALSEIQRDSEHLLAEIFETWGNEAMDEPSHKKAMRSFIESYAPTVIDMDTSSSIPQWEPIKWLWENFMRHPSTRELAWEKILWPLIQEKWPEYAREHKHFTGWGEFKLGGPLTNRKRWDGHTDLGIARHEKPMKAEFFASLDLHNRLDGTGAEALIREEG